MVINTLLYKNKNIPEYVLKNLSKETIEVLDKGINGISFPDPSGCQLRIVREKKVFGGFYSYNHYGGYDKAIKAALIDGEKIKQRERITGHITKDFVYWRKRYNKRRGVIEYGYVVYVKVKGRSKSKSFGFGTHKPSPNKQFHAYRTARLFRHYYEVLGDDIMEHWYWFSKWKHVRLYYKDQPFFDWLNE